VDHNVPTTDRSHGIDDPEAALQVRTLAENCAEFGIEYFNELDPDIRLFGGGKFAIVTYYFDMSFDMGGQNIKLKGRDMFSLVNENSKWWVVADQFSPNPA